MFSAAFIAGLALISSCVSVEAAVADNDCKIILESTAAGEIKNGLMDVAASGKLYRVDAEKSSVSFSVRHFPFSRVQGRFHATVLRPGADIVDQQLRAYQLQFIQCFRFPVAGPSRLEVGHYNKVGGQIDSGTAAQSSH
jgi:hypothetical protein